MRISDWSSDVCSSDLEAVRHAREPGAVERRFGRQRRFGVPQFGAADALAAAGLAYQRRGGRRGLTGLGDQHRAIGAVVEIGSATVCTSVTYAQLICSPTIEKKNTTQHNAQILKQS